MQETIARASVMAPKHPASWLTAWTMMVAVAETAKTTSQILVILFRATSGNDSIGLRGGNCGLESKGK